LVGHPLHTLIRFGLVWYGMVRKILIVGTFHYTEVVNYILLTAF